MKLTTFLRVKDKFPHISNIASKMVHNKVTRVLYVFRSNFWLAHRTMLKLGREVKNRRVGKIKLKKVVFVNFFFVFSSIFAFQPIRTHHLIEIKIKRWPLLIDFAFCVPSSYAGHYLNLSCESNFLLDWFSASSDASLPLHTWKRIAPINLISSR